MSSISGSGRSPGGRNGNYSSILAWKIPWTEEYGGLQPQGQQRDTTAATHTHTHTHTHFLKSPSNERISMWQQTIIWLQYIFQECKYFMKYQSFRRTSENFFLTYLLPSTPPNPHTLSLLAFMKIGKPS